MTNAFPDFSIRPSRLIAWGLVAMVHVLLWLVLVKGMNVYQIMPLLKPVQITLVERPLPPVEPPAPPALPAPVVEPLFVPAPEVEVVRVSSSPITVATSLAPPVAETANVAQLLPAEPASTQLIVVSESEVDYLVKPEVRYPLAARRAREQGTVLLSVLVNQQGKVERVGVYRSSGFSRLDEAAIRAVRHMRVKPYSRNGIARAAEIRIPVEFFLSGMVSAV